MKKKHIILIHAIFWGIILVTAVLRIVPGIGEYSAGFLVFHSLVYAVSYVSIFYICYFYISKQHLQKGKTTRLIILGLVFTLLFSIPVTFVYVYFLFDIVFTLNAKKMALNFGRFYFRVLETNFMFVMSGSMLKLALVWYENVMERKEAEKQLIQGELALLRSQINPRFLSNTLSNIKALIGKQPAKAVYCIENLSEIMSYMLYETSAEKVPLDDEINYINNYLNLQKARYGQGQVKFDISGVTAGAEVPPLLFMPFLENAFRTNAHSTNTGSTGPGGIDICLEVKGNGLVFEISENVKDVYSIAEDKPFGSDTIKHFLDLQFGNNYSLDTNYRDNSYSVRLEVTLT